MENTRIMQTDGVIQYRLDFHPGPLPPEIRPERLFYWFAQCRRQGLIGRDPARYDGYAYGNISIRCARGFVISGTQTGGQNHLQSNDLSWVTAFDVGANSLTATGPARPSSEAMTHGQIYRARTSVNAVIHVHSPRLWRQAAALGLAVTPPEIGYGTPAMADAVAGRLAASTSTTGMLSMGGHEDGILAYAPDIDSAGRILSAALARAEALDDSARSDR